MIVGRKRYRCITMHQDLIGAVHDVMGKSNAPILETRRESNKLRSVVCATGVPELLYGFELRSRASNGNRSVAGHLQRGFVEELCLMPV